MHLPYLANSYFYNHKPMLCQHRVFQNLRKDKDTVITKTVKENGVVVFDWKLYDNAIQEITAGTFKFKKLNEDPTFKCEASLQRFYIS